MMLERHVLDMYACMCCTCMHMYSLISRGVATDFFTREDGLVYSGDDPGGMGLGARRIFSKLAISESATNATLYGHIYVGPRR